MTALDCLWPLELGLALLAAIALRRHLASLVGLSALVVMVAVALAALIAQ
ncbi:hypothetical protein IPZ58_07585 [Streptomyces roseoverticillatus]|nr:hypothetical protein [Streptomyces roseoverticillatus]MCF3101441.1 hypothetical protein [Streptomyces roseoverticillatus]